MWLGKKKSTQTLTISPWWKSQYSYGKPKYLFFYSTLGAGCKKKNVFTSGTIFKFKSVKETGFRSCSVLSSSKICAFFIYLNYHTDGTPHPSEILHCTYYLQKVTKTDLLWKVLSLRSNRTFLHGLKFKWDMKNNIVTFGHQLNKVIWMLIQIYIKKVNIVHPHMVLRIRSEQTGSEPLTWRGR